MDLLDNIVQPYAWGSRTALAALRGAPTPSPTPEAELWMGAHPGGPSRALRAGAWAPLPDRIAAAPDAELGARVVGSLGRELPFLLKVLAAEEPLSLQAHPTLEQARAGFDAEETKGVPRDAPHRNYKDRNHKPELICALGPFDALCGFRAVDELRELLSALGTLDALRARLDRGPDGLGPAFAWVMGLASEAREAREASVGATLAACERLRDRGGPFADACGWALRLGAIHPGDAGVIGALMLNLVRLAPGEAIYLPAGNLHAYLHGVGVEIMASSDNVLRGGLTPKHVDVPELLRVLDFRAGPVDKVLPSPAGDGVLERWTTPAREFALSRATLRGGSWTTTIDAATIVLCTEGALAARDARDALTLRQGQSAFVPAAGQRIALEGFGVAFLATVPL
ncbi:MAG: mannose-6-phosphate isomerase, class I [Deltaproteobacteria bacterium]|nr:mannose-6-phosphate isomerase, class I [Deltaproteobacteria bacterium]